MEDKLLEAIKVTLKEELGPIKDKLNSLDNDIKGVKEEIKGVKGEIKDIKDDLKTIKSQQEEDHLILRALEHRTEVNGAEHAIHFALTEKLAGKIMIQEVTIDHLKRSQSVKYIKKIIAKPE